MAVSLHSVIAVITTYLSIDFFTNTDESLTLHGESIESAGGGINSEIGKLYINDNKRMYYKT